MRWLTPDPIGFKDGLNLYAYVRNNPFYFRDPKGQFVIALPVLTWVFGSTISWVTLAEIGTAIATAGVFLALNNVEKLTDKEAQLEEEKKKGKRAGKDNQIKGGPRRDLKTGEYLSDPAAGGNPHTTIGIKHGSKGPYTQGATFEDNKFKGRTDVTDHGRNDHPNPHFYPQQHQMELEVLHNLSQKFK